MNRLLCWRSGDRTRATRRPVLVYGGAALAAGESTLNNMLDSRQYGGDHQIPDGPTTINSGITSGAVVDHLDRVEQFRHRQHVHHRRPFGEADNFVKPGRQDGAQRLRENYAHGATPRRQTQRSGRLILTVVDPKEAPRMISAV